METGQYGTFALDFVDRVSGLSGKEDVFAAYRQAIGSFGFDYSLIAALTDPSSSTAFDFHLPHVPSEFLQLYAQRGYAEHDPVARHAIATKTPFEWRDARYDPVRETRAREVMERAHDHGLKFGFVIPVHSVERPSACISMSGRDRPDLNARTKPGLHLMSLYTLSRVQQMSTGARPLGLPLSEREREVLIWSALGRDASDIGDILGLTERTVNFHMGMARRKLGASNKTHAVALALAQRAIRL